MNYCVKFKVCIHVCHNFRLVLFHEVFEVIDVADLRWDCHAFLVRGANITVEHESFVGRFAETREDKIATNHYTRSTLSSLTVYGSNIVFSCIKECMHVFAEGKHHVKRWRVVVIKRELL